MAFHDTSAQFNVRGTPIQTVVYQGARSVFTAIGHAATSVVTTLIKAGEASARTSQIDALRAKSDAELAEMGLKRDQIVEYVFKDLMYL